MTKLSGHGKMALTESHTNIYIYIFQRRLREDLDKGARPALELNPSAAELEFRVCEVESFGFRIFRLCTV